ncbi:MAG: hypothetical protein HC846_03505 [Blastocatellia bacterium]|nr:hypothetical protein [Blastocatellia bacterium]
MNVTFHIVGSIATAAVLSLSPTEKWHSASALKKYAIGFAVGILIHGVLDFLPHSYPLPSKIDVIFALLVLILSLFLAQNQNKLLVLFCFSGAIFPDVVDLGAGIANKHLGIPLPQLNFKISPWHWKEYSGSIYDGSRFFESTVYHILLLLICFSLIYAYRNDFLDFKSLEIVE